MSVYKIRHATAADTMEMCHLIREGLIASRGEPHGLESASKHFKHHPADWAICEYEGSIVGIVCICQHSYYEYIDTGGLNKVVDNVWETGLVYVKPEHRKKHRETLAIFLLLQDVIASRRGPLIYAIVDAEWGKRHLIARGFENIGMENMPRLRPPGRTEPYPFYRGDANLYVRYIQEDMKQVKVPYEFC